ncbi:ESPR-type extended signal peptide-containing protein, partial [Mitsuokella multacida]|uniref:ESPR-type extended signal peptide-containing protein n=1 Tax=Mitsuokella multacida TaxID=52226 RepID=UPI00242F0CDD
MNKVYKVVWNKARNCYVVASEFAKSHTKSHSGSTKRVRVGTTAALMAVAVLTGFAMPAQAAVSIGTDGTVKAEAADINALNNLLKNGVTTNKDGSVTVGGLTVKKNGEVSVNSPDVVYGKNAKIIWDSNNTMGQISIGNNATAITGRGGQEKAFAYDGDYNHAAGAIAIGANTYARTGSIMIGSHVYKGNMGDVKNIDTDSFNTGSDGAYGFTVNSTTIGTNSFTRGNLATTIGDYNIQSGRSVGYGFWNALNYGAQNFGATVIGALNSNESQSDIVSSHFGTSTSGVANSIVGVANRVNSSNGTLVFGAGNEVTHSLSDIYGVGDTTSLKDAKKAQDALKNAVAESNAGGAVLAIGGANKADWARKSQLIGVGNTLTGASSAVSEYNMINGYKNEVTNATHTSIIGSNNNARDVQATTVMGDNNALTGNGNHVIGDNHKVTGENNILIGNNKEQETHSGNDSVIIGNNASAGNGSMVMGNKAHAGNTGIALGMNASAGDGQNLAIGYYARVSGAKNSTALGYASRVEKRDILPSDSEDGVISVGKSVGQSGEAGITRRIINVKAGVNDTDAVNVSQLKGVKAEALKHSTVTNGDANITVTEGLNKDGGKEYKVALNNDITLAGDDPDAFVSISGSKGTIWTSGSVTAGSVAVGTAKADGTTPFFVDSNGAFYAADGKFSVDKDGNANANSIQTNALNSKYNLSVGTANVNGTMPFFVNSNGAFYAANGKLVVDKDGKVTATEGEIGNVVLQNGVYTGHSALRDAELFVGDADGNYSQITPKSAKLGQVTIDEKGNMAGVNSIQTNALNAKYNLSVGTANENGIMPFFVNSNGAFYGANNNFSVDKDGKVTATAGEIGNVVLDNGVFTGHSALRDGELFVGDASGNYSQITTKGAKLGKVTVAEDGKISGVAAGAVTADSTDAVNGSQLHAVATEAGKHSKVVSGNNINVEETDVDGQKFYKVNMNKDIMLGDLTGKNVSISGTNGTIEATGAIATKDRVHADNGAKLADIDVTGNKISNGASSIVLDGSNVKVNDKVTFDQNGNIAGVNSIQTNALNAKYNLS